MSGSVARKSDEPKGGAPRAARTAPRMFRDPVVMWMSYAALGLVILFLATVVGALLTGVVRSESPRSALERDMIEAAAALKTGKGTGGEWSPYIETLISNGDLQKARVALQSAKASVTATMAPELILTEARLDLAEKDFEPATKVADSAMKAFEARQALRLKAGGATAKRARELGIEQDYYNAALVKAYAYVGLHEWKDAVSAFDVYLKTNATASDILVDRGNAKASMKDVAGAEKDFREALRFVPDDKEALDGLKRIGVSK